LHTELWKFLKDKHFEVCAVKLKLWSKRFCIITIYRASTGNIDIFLTKLDIILRNLYSSSQAHVIINYFNDNKRESKLDTVLKTYNVVSIVNFPTRIQGNSAKTIYNTSIDMRRDDYSVRPIINGLSDHDAQSITLNTLNMNSCYTI
jgi:hypothetical protein